MNQLRSDESFSKLSVVILLTNAHSHMKTQHYQLEILYSCHLPWQQMPEVGDGRYCHQCDKIVPDLRQAADDEVVRTMLAQGEHACGIVHNSQLNRVLTLRESPQQRNHRLLHVLLGSMTLLYGTLSQHSKAQAAAPKRQEQVIGDSTQGKASSEKKIAVLPRCREIEGRVISDDSTAKFLPFAKLKIPKYGITSICNNRGYFHIDLPDYADDDSVSVTFEYLFYKTKTIVCKVLPDSTIVRLQYDAAAEEKHRQEVKNNNDDVTVGLMPARLK